MHNFKQLIISLDQSLLCLFGTIHVFIGWILIKLYLKRYVEKYFDFNFKVYADETISSYSWQKQNDNYFWKFLRIFIDLLFFFEKDHCKTSYESEINGTQHSPKDRF